MSAVEWDPAREADGAEAARFLELLGVADEPFYVQAIAEGPRERYAWEEWTRRDGSTGETPYSAVRRNGKLTKLRATTKDAVFTPDEVRDTRPYQSQNMAGSGVFFAVNALKDGETQRKNDHITRVRALPLDLDGAPLPERFPVEPTAVVESSPGKFHVYWAVHGWPLEECRPAVLHLAGLYGGDVAVADLARLMRLPGYFHNKGGPFRTRLLSSGGRRYTREELL